MVTSLTSASPMFLAFYPLEMLGKGPSMNPKTFMLAVLLTLPSQRCLVTAELATLQPILRHVLLHL